MRSDSSWGHEIRGYIYNEAKSNPFLSSAHFDSPRSLSASQNKKRNHMAPLFNQISSKIRLFFLSRRRMIPRILLPGDIVAKTRVFHECVPEEYVF